MTLSSNFESKDNVKLLCYLKNRFSDDSKNFTYFNEIQYKIRRRMIEVPQIFSKFLNQLYKKYQTSSYSYEIRNLIVSLPNNNANDVIVEDETNEYVSYEKIFSDMDNGDKTFIRMSKYFWHVTSLKNAISIVNSGRFFSRNKISNYNFDDLRKLSKLSDDVQCGNLSDELHNYVRFYLRPLNKPLFAIQEIYKEKFGCDAYVTFAVDRICLKESFKQTLLTYHNASQIESWLLNPHINSYNLRSEKYFKVETYKYLNFDKVYSKYEKTTNDLRLQQAEFLVLDFLPIKFIKKIYFLSVNALNKFLTSIRNSAFYNFIKDRCVIKNEYEYGE